MLPDVAFKEPTCGRYVTAGGQKEVDGLAQAIDGSVQILLLAAHEHVGLVDAP